MNKISDVLLKLRVRPNLRGYNYLKSAVELALEDWGKIYKPGVMYQEIAEMYNVTPESVGRAMRYAIVGRRAPKGDLKWLIKYGRITSVKAFVALAVEEVNAK